MVVCNYKNKQIESNKSKYQNIIYQITAHMNKFTDKFTNLLMKSIKKLQGGSYKCFY